MSKHDNDKCLKELHDLINSDLPTGERLEKFMDRVDTDALYEDLAIKGKIAHDTGLPILSICDHFVCTLMEVYKPDWFKKKEGDHPDVPDNINKMIDELFKAIDSDMRNKKAERNEKAVEKAADLVTEAIKKAASKES